MTNFSLTSTSPAYVHPDPRPAFTTSDLAGGGSLVSAPSNDLGLAPATAGGAVFLTPDALLAYCQSRLDSIDGQVRAAFSQQQLRNSESSAIQGVLQTFQASSGGVTSDSQSCARMETALHDLIEKLKASDPGCPELPRLEQTYNDAVRSGTGPTSALPYEDEGLYPPKQSGPEGDNTFSNTEMQTFISSLQGCASDLNSGSELQMIQLQSLMSQRQTAVQLTTNLVQSLGDQAQKIAENIGR
jgi:hypothetical protein